MGRDRERLQGYYSAYYSPLSAFRSNQNPKQRPDTPPDHLVGLVTGQIITSDVSSSKSQLLNPPPQPSTSPQLSSTTTIPTLLTLRRALLLSFKRCKTIIEDSTINIPSRASVRVLTFRDHQKRRPHICIQYQSHVAYIRIDALTLAQQTLQHIPSDLTP